MKPLCDNNYLIVEDNPAVARVLSLMLGGYGGESVICRSLAQALGQLRETRVDAVIADLNLVDAHGLQVLDALSRNAFSGPVILTSGYSVPDALASRLGGPIRFVPKPFTPGALLSALESATRTVSVSTATCGSASTA